MITSVFKENRARGRATLIPYMTAGYPGAGDTVEVLDALVSEGADILEVGIPFSDPLADGPTIQRSSFISLENGTTVARVFDDVARFRTRHQTPVVLFTYLNPLLRYGVVPFLTDAAAAGAQGVLVTDLPTGCDPDLESQITESPLDLIRLLAPTTAPGRIAQVAEGGSGFLYYISRTGVTGAGADLSTSLGEEVRAVKEAIELPVAVGFGISRPEHARSVASVADGVVVGSALIQALNEGGISKAAAFLGSLRQAMDETPIAP